jgi:hypothetical protein
MPESRNHDEWIIDRLMPEREVNLLAGPAGVGKTTLALQMLSDIQDGNMVFGHRTSPTGVVFVSCDRSKSAHQRMIEGMAIPPSRFVFFSTDDRATSIPPSQFVFFSARNRATSIDIIVKSCASLFPQHKLLFIDGFGTLVPGGKISDFGQTSTFLSHAGELCELHNRTILGSVHAAKTKEGEHYANPRQRVLGSVAWSAFADLVITIDPEKPDDPSNLVRIVNVLPRDSQEFTLKFLREGGRLVLYEDPDLLTIVEVWIRKQPFEREIPTREIVKYAADQSIAHGTLAQGPSGGRELGAPPQGILPADSDAIASPLSGPDPHTGGEIMRDRR